MGYMKRIGRFRPRSKRTDEKLGWQRNLVEEEIGVEVILGEVISATRTIALVVEVGDDAHVAEAVAAGRQEGVLDDPHADGAEQILVALGLRLGLRLHRRRGPSSVGDRGPLGRRRRPSHVRGLRRRDGKRGDRRPHLLRLRHRRHQRSRRRTAHGRCASGAK